MNYTNNNVNTDNTQTDTHNIQQSKNTIANNSKSNINLDNSTSKSNESTAPIKPKSIMSAKTFDELYENFKDDPFYGPLIHIFKTYRDYIKNTTYKRAKEWVNQNYKLYTQVKLLLVDKDFNKVSKYIDMINKIFLLDKVTFSPLNLLRYDYIWPGTLADRKEWLELFTLLIELAHPAIRKERLKMINLNEGLTNLSNGLKENIKKYYTLR